MAFLAQYGALVKKHFLTKARSPIAMLVELTLPALIFIVLVIVKKLLPPEEVEGSLHLDDVHNMDQTNHLKSLQFQMSFSNSSLAFYPEAKATPIIDYLIANGFPQTSITTFSNVKALDDYVLDMDYGVTARPIYAAVGIDDLDGPDYDYKLRFNVSRGQAQGVPNPMMPSYNWYQKAFSTETANLYTNRGFAVLQSIVDGYIMTKEKIFAWPNATNVNGGDTTLNTNSNNNNNNDDLSINLPDTKTYDEAIKIQFQPMPTRSYLNDLFMLIAGGNLGFLLTLVFIWPVTKIVSGLVEEKETRQQALMKLMGLSNTALVAAWLTLYTVFFALVSVLICLCSFWGVYEHSQVIFPFLIFFFFGLSVFAFGYLISAFFQKAKTAATFAAIIFLCSFFVFLALGENPTTQQQLMVSLVPSVALALTGQTISQLESLGEGATARSVWDKIDGYSVMDGIGMLLVDFILYFLLAVYFNQVIKSEFTVSRPWYFPFTPSFWFGTPADRSSSVFGAMCCRETKQNLQLPPIDPNVANEGPLTKLQPSKRAQAGDTPIVQVRGLRKTFPSEKSGLCSKHPDFVAVKGTSFDLYDGEICALLGENGAGKTTTFSCLSGLLEPTSGDVVANGYSLKNDIQKIYTQQGVCFQHDVLFPTLTVYEHMELFAPIKGWKGTKLELEDHILGLLDDVGLGPKADNKINHYPPQLSGGQRRKLSLALALLCDSKIIYLDEPSSGVDVASQRALRETILANRAGRVFIITTHAMEEAQALADVIAIYAAGKLLCMGSQLYLKEQYGVGYSLTINKHVTANAANDQLLFTTNNNNANNFNDTNGNNNNNNQNLFLPNNTTSNISTRSSSSKKQRKGDDLVNTDSHFQISTQSGKLINDYITQRYPFCKLLNDTAGEIGYRLPLDHSPYFADMLDDLEARKTELNITTLGLGVTSLTEVFLTAVSGQTREDEEHDNEEEDALLLDMNNNKADNVFITDSWQQNDDGTNVGDAISHTSSYDIFMRHFWALFIKRFHYAKRDRKAFISQIVQPGVILLLGCIMTQYSVKMQQQWPEREIFAGTNYPAGGYFPIALNPTNIGIETKELIFSSFESIANQFGKLNIIDTTTSLLSDDDINNNITIDSRKAMQEYLNETFYDRDFKTPRFGALYIDKMNNIPAPKEDDVVPTITPTFVASLHYNTTAIDSLPIFTNLLNNALLQTNIINNKNTTIIDNNGDDNVKIPTITTRSLPMPTTTRQLTFTGSTVAFIICIALSFVPASFAAYIVRERTDNIKHLQMVSGVSNVAYWLSSLAWDICNFLPTFGVFIIILFGYDFQPIMETVGSMLLVVVILWLYIIASLPFTYCLSFLFDSHTAAQNFTLLINFLGSVVLLILSIMLAIIKSSQQASKYLRYVFRLLPAYALGDAFAFLFVRQNVLPNSTSGWDLDVCGLDLIFLILDTIIYTGLLILLERWASNNTLEWLKGGCVGQRRSAAEINQQHYQDGVDDMQFNNNTSTTTTTTGGNDINDALLGMDNISNCPTINDNNILGQQKKFIPPFDDGRYIDPEEDSDVREMRLAIQNGMFTNSDDAPVVSYGLRKVYPVQGKEFLAVANAYLTVKNGECLALLGANGAGKSSLMKMLVSDVYPTEGDACIGGYSLVNQSQKIRHMLSYVPQFDALLPLLTPREHLELYANIKCVPKDKINDYVNFLLDKAGLTHLADRPTEQLSGGNRRKTSLACALVGNGRVHIYDELSTGIDPRSRKILWNLISSTMKNKALILCTHNLEEANSLATNITIMASGRLRCYGTPLHIKDKYGRGFEIDIECRVGQEDLAKNWFCATFSNGLQCVEEYRSTLRYAIPRNIYKMSDVFRLMEDAKQRGLGIENFTVSITSLDSIFVDFIKKDDERRALNDNTRT